jgi:hypothetical protein
MKFEKLNPFDTDPDLSVEKCFCAKIERLKLKTEKKEM